MLIGCGIAAKLVGGSLIVHGLMGAPEWAAIGLAIAGTGIYVGYRGARGLRAGGRNEQG
jgi:F0F1-type ATP synthase membrane subunit c/vacuolar-type H+-ATPase subunit K